MFRTPTFRFLLGLGLCSLGGAMLYIYYKNRDEDEDIIDGTVPKNSFSNKNQQHVKIQMILKNDMVPVIIGRSGANLKIIEDKTGTVIQFREKDDNHHYCEISGIKNDVLEAKELLLKEMQKTETVEEEIFVPQSACGTIFGRCGELQEICRKSLAKVALDHGDRGQSNTTRRLIITGNHNQVKIAKKLIEEKIKEDEEYRKSLEKLEQRREPRRSPTTSISSTHSSMNSSTLSNLLPNGEKLLASSSINGQDDKPLEVYVSAIASPSKFWLQLVGPQSHKLDELVEQMTEYYEIEDNQKLHKIADPYLGQIVAALFKYDGKWYRAKIVSILPNEYNPRDVVLDLYFVDYGDSEYVAPHEVFELRTDFLTLRFQAIECFLAHIKPAPPSENDMWDQQAIAKFEELTHVASWKKLVTRVVTSKERPKGRGKREGSPVPGVELFDATGDFEINIAHALVAEGLAVPDYEQQQQQQQKQNNVLRLDGGDSKLNEVSPITNATTTTTNSQFNNTANDLGNTTLNQKSQLSSPSSSSSSSTTQNGHNNHQNREDKILNGTTNHQLSSQKQNSSENFIQNEKKSQNKQLGSQISNKNNNVVIDKNWERTVQS